DRLRNPPAHRVASSRRRSRNESSSAAATRTAVPIRIAVRSPRLIRRRTVSSDTSRRPATVPTEYRRVHDCSCVRLPIEAHACGLWSYAARTVTRSSDVRDLRAVQVQEFVDAAIRDGPAERQATATLFFGDRPVGPPPGRWPQPTVGGRERASSQSRAA